MVLYKISSRYIYPLLFGMPRLAVTFSHTALFVLTFPLVVLHTVGPETKGLHLGLVNGLASVISIILVLAAGRYADHRSSQNQHKLMVAGSLCVALPPLAMVALGPPYWLMATALITLFLSRILTDAAVLTLLTNSDHLAPKENYSAALTFQHFLGSTLGAVVFGLLPISLPFLGLTVFFPVAAVAFGVTALGIIGFWISTSSVPVTLSPASPPSFKFTFSNDYKCFLVARICFLAAMLVVPIFLVFMVRDLMEVENVRRFAATLMICALIGGLISSAFSGKMVRQLGEVRMLYRAGAIIALTAPVLIFGAAFKTLAIGCMVVFGAGFGAIMVAGISLSVKLVADAGVAGRAMAVVTASTFISQLLASVLGGLILDALNRMGNGWGYWGLLVMVEILLAAGAWYLRKIQIDHP